jgi:predicted MPP superfamily phosphohydrolase
MIDRPNWRLVAAGAAALVSALALRAFLIEPLHVEITRHDLPLPGLPVAWEGARLVHLTDLHAGDPHSERLLSWMVEQVNALKPDLIVITGDYVMRDNPQVAQCARHLAALRSRYGTWGVLGDHDFLRSTEEPVPGLIEAIEAAGVRLLRNASAELPGGLRLGGSEPYTCQLRRARLDLALETPLGDERRETRDESQPAQSAPRHSRLSPLASRVERSEGPHLLLAHSPDIIGQASRRRVPVVLCGHTHGGQVVAPFFGPPLTHTQVGRRFASGWSRMDGTRMYTGRGLASHFSLRLFCRPEITLFTLRHA